MHDLYQLSKHPYLTAQLSAALNEAPVYFQPHMAYILYKGANIYGL